MMRHEYAKVARAALLDELLAAGILDARVEMDDTTVWVTTAFDRALVDPVVGAHDAAAIDAAAGAAEEADTTNRDLARAAIDTLTADIAALGERADAFRADAATMPATLTAAQVRGRLIQIEDGVADLADAVARTDRALRAVINYLARRGL